MQLSLDLAHSAPPIPFPAAPAPQWTRTRFLESVRANMLRRADELEAIAQNFQGLPAMSGVVKMSTVYDGFGREPMRLNLPAFQMSAEHRQEIRASAASIRETYSGDWLSRELARWNMHAEETIAA